MNNTIFNYFTPKTTRTNCSSVKNRSSSSSTKSVSSLPRRTCRSSPSNDAVITISSDEEDEQVAVSFSKRRKITETTHVKALPVQSAIPLQSTEKENNQDYPGNKIDSDTANNNTSAVEDDKTIADNANVDTRSSDLPYYLKNFRLAIDTVINDEKDAILFEGEDATWIKNFYHLSFPCQKLYTRLFHRKYAWLPIRKVS